ncbi:hypothetical protein BKD26_36870 [Streptomyces sp. CB03238]|nr:hypothetical protein BKD26_36870 [Streptomyces sp. CB03238]
MQQFAYELRKLREEAGSLTYRVMAQETEYSVATLAQAAAGEKLPSLPVTLAYVRACGGDTGDWERRWRKARREVARAAVPDEETSYAPYQGLARFDVGDSDRFFGRSRLTDDLLHCAGSRRVTTVFGPSGSGKSSLLRAGLIPRLRHNPDPLLGPAAIRILTPGARPLREHGKLFAPARGSGDTWLIVDQFEEVFTLCRDPAERDGFVTRLLSARDCGSRLRVVLGVRADFYGRCLQHSGLATVIRDSSLPVAPMTSAELREAIVKPAAAAWLVVERALTARLIEEVAEEPGGLPLLSHALLETWRRRHGRTLSLEAYQATGGIHGAIAQTAEEIYCGLSSQQAAAARHILLRLITPGEGTQDTRRPVDLAELGLHSADMPPADRTGAGGDTSGVLERLAKARLVTLDDHSVNLAHEALITSWPRLRRWIDDDRSRLVTQRRLTEAAQAWDELGRDSGALYRGNRLSVLREWAAREGSREELNAVERDFFDASLRLEESERAAEVRRHRHLQMLAATLAMLLIVAAGAGVVAVQQRQEAVHQRQITLSRQLAAQALALAPTRPLVAKLLSVEAYRTAPTAEARGALLTMSTYQYHQTEFTGHSDAVSDIAFGPRGTLASVSRDRKIMLWDARRRTRIATLTAHHTWLRAVAFSPNGRMLATGGDDTKVVLWDAATRKRIATLAGHTELVKSLAFSPDGRTLASASTDGRVILWDPAKGLERRTLQGHKDGISTVAFSPDGRTVATAGTDRTVRLWDADTGTRKAVLTGHGDAVTALAFSPDGQTIASAGNDHKAILWDADRGTRTATLTGHMGEIRALAFSRDGRMLATGGLDRTVMLWDATRATRTATLTGHGTNIYGLAFAPGPKPLLASTGENGTITLWDPSRIALTGHTDRVNEVVFSPDGRALATASDDGTAGLWDLRYRNRVATLSGRTGQVNGVAFRPDGRELATATGSAVHPPRAGDYTLTLWQTAAPFRRTARLTGYADRVLRVAYSPDSRTVATAAADDSITLWDTGRKTRLATLTHGTRPARTGRGDGPATRAKWGANAVAFSPDGRTLASAGHDGSTVLWDVARRSRRLTLTGHTGSLRAVAFSPDGRTLATAGLDRTVILWDTARGTRLATLTSDSSALDVAFSPDGSTLATADEDTTVVLWDLADRQKAAILTGHTRQVRTLAFSPDGRTLATGGVDTKTVLWNTDAERTVAQLCATVSRNLTPQEWERFSPGAPHRRTCG